nr:SdpI family protein [Eisenbergiella sp.]
MWFWFFMFVCNLLIPITLIAGGKIMQRHPPKSVNCICGYRTSMSMKNEDTWIFAQKTCGKLWWKLSWFVLVPSVIIQFPFYKSDEDVIGLVGGILCTVQCVILVASVYPVEKALKKYFNKDGTRREAYPPDTAGKIQ